MPGRHGQQAGGSGLQWQAPGQHGQRAPLSLMSLYSKKKADAQKQGSGYQRPGGEGVEVEVLGYNVLLVGRLEGGVETQ